MRPSWPLKGCALKMIYAIIDVSVERRLWRLYLSFSDLVSALPGVGQHLQISTRTGGNRRQQVATMTLGQVSQRPYCYSADWDQQSTNLKFLSFMKNLLKSWPPLIAVSPPESLARPKSFIRFASPYNQYHTITLQDELQCKRLKHHNLGPDEPAHTSI
jgi:hypothetical protein